MPTPTICVIDVETTGVEESDQVCEIGGIFTKVGTDGFTDVLRIEQTLVKPTISIPPTASAVHHITDEMVTDAPAFDEAIKQFEGADIYVAHKADFDRRWLASLSANWVCTYRVAYDEWADAPSFGNQALSYWLGTPRPPKGCGHAHRAVFDCHTTLGILCRLRSLGWKWGTLLQTSAHPRLLREVPFGKHKGEKWSDVPRSYIDWMKRTGGWEDDINHTLKELF